MTSHAHHHGKAPAKGLPEHLKAYKGVWVYVELERGRVHPVSYELLGEGRKLADALNVPLSGVVIGPKGPATDAAVAGSVAHGADKVFVVKDEVLEHYRTDPYTLAMTTLVNKYQPEILLLGATTLGRDLAGAVATTLRTGLTADCTALTIDHEGRSLAATRPTFGGSLLCTIHTLNYRPQMATVRPRVMSMPAADANRVGEIIVEPVAFDEAKIVAKVLEYIPDRDVDKAHLAFADVIVAAGKGMGRPDNLRLIKDLATVLGAEIGVTRPLVQMGWVGPDRQVGQTGKTVRPKLYIAAGISGAIQHRVGMESSEVILAINRDPNAPIFDFATYGMVGDVLELLPALTRSFRERLASGQSVAA